MSTQVLKTQLLKMGAQAEHAITRVLQALADRNDSLANAVRADDSILDQLEMDVDEICISLLAHRPPVSELRLIFAAMRISQNLERVGDEATTIARKVVELSRESPLLLSVDLPHMAALGTQMLKGALDAFLHHDTGKAREIIPRDREVDRLHKELHSELAALIRTQPDTVTACLNLMVISKSLERIGDHATNIAEAVVDLYDGQDIRHDPSAKRPAPAKH